MNLNLITANVNSILSLDKKLEVEQLLGELSPTALSRFLDNDIVAAEGPTRPSSGSHIDFFLISNNLRSDSFDGNKVTCITLDLISDHFLVFLSIQLQSFSTFPTVPLSYKCFKNTKWTSFNHSLNSIQ